MTKSSLSRTHETLPSRAGCDHCRWTFSVTDPALNAEVYRAAKDHARELPGHVAHASVTHTHRYVVVAKPNA